MKVILKQSIDALGLEGDTVNVAIGYARNYLIPKGFALLANRQNIKFMESQKKKIELRRLKALEDAEKVKTRMADLVITIPQKVGEEDRLYGSVTAMDIAARMEEAGVVIDRRKILLDKPIKTLGEFNVPIKIYPKVNGSVKVLVVPAE
ncbi:MAG: 50S ribosomal protein L9 [Deltaproteobacteria bacterium]|nr:50S ribosomal protein L9 [Deltaproteobacteria bacterium]